MKTKLQIHARPILITIVAVLAVVALLSFFYRYSERSRAANEQAQFLLDPTAVTIAPGQDASINIDVTAQSPIQAAIILIQFPKNLVTFKNIVSCGEYSQVLKPTVIPGTSLDTVAITVSSSAPKSELPTGIFCMETVVFTGLADGSGVISLAPADTILGQWKWEIAGSDSNNFDPVISADNQVAVTVGQLTPTPIPGVRLEVVPSQTTAQITQLIDVPIILNAGSKAIDAVSAIVKYDQTSLQAITVQEGTAFDTYIQTAIDNTQGRVTVEAILQNDDGVGIQGSSTHLATIQFQAIRSGSTEIRILCNPPVGGTYPACDPASDTLSQVSEYKIEGSGALSSVLNSTIDISLLTPTPTPTLSGGPYDMDVGYKVRLQGITQQPKNTNPIDAVVSLAEGGQIIDTRIVTFASQSDGTWFGRTGYNGLTTAADYTVFIKGPKHLQKKICTNTPTESIGGMYRCQNGTISLQSGAQTLNFTEILLLAGDLPLQNGLIDSVDISYIRNNLGNKDADVVARGDLNYDGIVDSQDYSLVINALGFKYDEEE